MTKLKITTEVACSIRFELKLPLPVKGKEYTNPRVQHIAERQAELKKEHSKLDAELIKLNSLSK